MAISKKPFGVTPDGHDVTQFTLTNARGASVRVINYGAILTNIIVPDRNGVLDDVALGFDNLEGYLANHGSMGDTVGRYGNRIAQARFTIDGATYQLDRNNGENHLHGVLSSFGRPTRLKPQTATSSACITSARTAKIIFPARWTSP